MYERHQIGCLNRHYLQRTIGVLVATTFFHLCSQISKFKNKRWILRTKAFLKKLKKLQKVQNFDIIHSHLIHADFLMAMFKKFVKEDFKLVSTKHGFQEWYNNKYGFDAGVKKNNFYLRVAKFAEKQMDASIAISKGLRDLYVGLKISKQKRIHLIHYGLDFPEKIELDASKRFWKNQLVLVGRLTAFKGHRYALEALKLVSEKLDDVGLVIVGSGQLEDELKNYTEELGLKNHVNFIGYSPDARSFMFNSDVVLVPSVSEGTSTTSE